jgi:hypothetical protein
MDPSKLIFTFHIFVFSFTFPGLKYSNTNLPLILVKPQKNFQPSKVLSCRENFIEEKPEFWNYVLH